MLSRNLLEPIFKPNHNDFIHRVSLNTLEIQGIWPPNVPGNKVTTITFDAFIAIRSKSATNCLPRDDRSNCLGHFDIDLTIRHLVLPLATPWLYTLWYLYTDSVDHTHKLYYCLASANEMAFRLHTFLWMYLSCHPPLVSCIPFFKCLFHQVNFLKAVVLSSSSILVRIMHILLVAGRMPIRSGSQSTTL